MNEEVNGSNNSYERYVPYDNFGDEFADESISPWPSEDVSAPPSTNTARRGYRRRGRGRGRGRNQVVKTSSTAVRNPSERIKRAKKVFDPSIEAGGNGSSNTVVVRRKSSPRCDVCSHTISQSQEELLFCETCAARAHPSCLGYSLKLASRSRMGPWTCMDCKLCCVCNMDHMIGTMIFCDECDRAYHMTCHQPPLNEQPLGQWVCFICKPNPLYAAFNSVQLGLTTLHESPVPDEESHISGGSCGTFDSEVPDVAEWSSEQVVVYFREKGFEEFAQVFVQQDIDGLALLMLSRSDVILGLNLRLGPALKIYKQVRILQTRLSNPPMP